MEAVVPGSLGQQYRRPDGGHQTRVASLVCVSSGLQGSPGAVGQERLACLKDQPSAFPAGLPAGLGDSSSRRALGGAEWLG